MTNGPRLRTRERGFSERDSIVTFGYRDVNNDYGTVTNHRLWTDEYSSMNDVVGNPGQFNFVNHSRFTWKNPKITSLDLPGVGLPGYHVTMSPYWLPKSGTLHSWEPVLTPGLGLGEGSSSYQAFVNEAFFALGDQVDAYFDMPNAIRDLVDLSSLIKQVVHQGGRLWSLFSRVMSAQGRRVTNPPLRELSREIANTHLLNQFGVKPLIGEVSRCLDRSQKIYQRLAFLQKTAGKTFRVYHSKSVKISHSDVFSFNDGNILGAPVWLRNINESGVYSASALVQNNLLGLDDMLGGITAFLAGMGFGRLAVFAWDLVPFSFVVDYFIGLNEWIKQHLTAQPFAGSLKILDGGISFKSLLTGDYWIESPYGAPEFAGTITIKSYKRKQGFPVDASVYTRGIGGLTPSQWGILTALLLQRE